MKIGHALAQGIDRHAQHLHAHAVFHAGAGRQAEYVEVVQRLVVVVLDVVHHLGGLAHIACGLPPP